MNRLRRANWFLFAAAALSPSAFAVDSRPSVSASRQILVYCDDPQARARVATFADETKAAVLAVLGLPDRWRFPIIITLERAQTASPRPKSQVGLFEMETGFKVGVHVVLGDEGGDGHFPNDVVRAVLLECAYRPTPTIKSGRAYPEPPDWLVEAIITAVRQRQAGENVEVFKTLVASGKVPALRDFLAENPSALDATSRGLYDAQALSLLQLLIELPQGRASLAAYAQDFPRGDGGNPAGHLLAHFPTLAGSEQSLGKWWALSLARLASSDRFHGASPEETERQLAALLTIEVLQKDTARKFEIGQFAEYLKIPASRAALRNRILDLAALSTGAHALFRPVIAEYEQILAQIERGKIKDVPKQLASAATYRAMILSRLGDINDYLNWIEATQTPTESGAFKSNASALPASPKRADAISKYLDAMEKAFND